MLLIHKINLTNTSIVCKLEAVACKDWLTNKVDRSVTGKVARQQCQGQIQLPLSDCGVVAPDHRGADRYRHSSVMPRRLALLPEAGSVLSVAESIYQHCGGFIGRRYDQFSLSANWWPRCHRKVKTPVCIVPSKRLSDFAAPLTNVPTGKDSLWVSKMSGERKDYQSGNCHCNQWQEVAMSRKSFLPY